MFDRFCRKHRGVVDDGYMGAPFASRFPDHAILQQPQFRRDGLDGLAISAKLHGIDARRSPDFVPGERNGQTKAMLSEPDTRIHRCRDVHRDHHTVGLTGKLRGRGVDLEPGLSVIGGDPDAALGAKRFQQSVQLFLAPRFSRELDGGQSRSPAELLDQATAEGVVVDPNRPRQGGVLGGDWPKKEIFMPESDDPRFVFFFGQSQVMGRAFRHPDPGRGSTKTAVKIQECADRLFRPAHHPSMQIVDR